MFIQLAIGGITIVLTLVLQVLVVSSASATLTKYGAALARPPTLMKTMLSLIAVVLWLVLGITASAWIWASVFLLLDAIATLEASLYFSVVTFTTLGYGDITLPPQWRLLASLTAVNGLIIFGLNTAFLVEFMSQLRQSQSERS